MGFEPDSLEMLGKSQKQFNREKRAADGSVPMMAGQLTEIERLMSPRAEWLAVASHALPMIREGLPRSASMFAAVDAVIAEADRRWPR